MKRILTAVGLGVGLAVGIACLFQFVVTAPAFLTEMTRSVATALQGVLLPNDDRIGVFVLEAPVFILITSVIGGVAGFLLGAALDLMRRRKS